MFKIIIALVLLTPTFSISQVTDLSVEEQKILEMEKELQARKNKLKKKQEIKNKKIAEIRKKQAELKAQEEALYASKKVKKKKTLKISKSSKKMRKRDFYVDGSGAIRLVFEDIFSFDQGDDIKQFDNALNLEAGKNFGFFEIGLSFFKQHANRNATDTDQLDLGVKGNYNFIRNAPGNDIIPFLSLEINIRKLERIGANSSVENSTSVTIGAGVKYFPLGEFLAIQPFLSYRNVAGTNPNVQDFQGKGLRTGADLLFYF